MSHSWTEGANYSATHAPPVDSGEGKQSLHHDPAVTIEQFELVCRRRVRRIQKTDRLQIEIITSLLHGVETIGVWRIDLVAEGLKDDKVRQWH